jgi:hypothetical protein
MEFELQAAVGRANATRSGGCPASPVASAMISPSVCFYAADSYTRISAEGRFQAVASGK